MNSKQKSMIFGAILGAGVGTLAGLLFSRGLDVPRPEEEEKGLSLSSIPPGQLVAIFIGIMVRPRNLLSAALEKPCILKF